MTPEDLDTETTSGSIGNKALAGGAIAAFLGILLLVLGPSPTPGVPLNPHQLAYLFLGFGVLLIVGVIARWL